MKRLPTPLALALAALLAAPWTLPGQERTPEARGGAHHERPGDPETAVRRTVEAFKDALRAADSATALSLLHPEARIYEGGHAESVAEYRAGHLGADIAFLQAVRTETLTEQVVVGDDLALYLSETRTRGSFRGREIDAHGVETIALVQAREAPHGWTIRHIHWSSR